MLLFGLGFVAGGAACSAASWFYYVHHIAARVEDVANVVVGQVATVQSAVNKVAAQVVKAPL